MTLIMPVMRNPGQPSLLRLRCGRKLMPRRIEFSARARRNRRAWYIGCASAFQADEPSSSLGARTNSSGTIHSQVCYSRGIGWAMTFFDIRQIYGHLERLSRHIDGSYGPGEG